MDAPINGPLYNTMSDVNNCGPAALAYAMVRMPNQSLTELELYNLIYAMSHLERGQLMEMRHVITMATEMRFNVRIILHMTAEQVAAESSFANIQHHLTAIDNGFVYEFGRGWCDNLILHYVPGHWMVASDPYFKTAKEIATIISPGGSNVLLLWSQGYPLSDDELIQLTTVFLNNDMHYLFIDGLDDIPLNARRVIYQKLAPIQC